MKNDQSKFRHDKSQYERPLLNYKCGRSVFWRKSCHQGPSFKGKCGGSSDCIPVRNGDRFECRRSVEAGGSCSEGPSSSGACSHTSPPCRPRLSLRAWRARITFLIMSLMVALIVIFSNFSSNEQPDISMLAINAGELHSVHANFANGEKGCTTCHEAHDKNTWEWLKAAFNPKDMSDSCLMCHQFEGNEKLSHNHDFSERRDMVEQQCTACHTEHKGSKADLVEISNEQCGTSCHEKEFTSFREHPEFAENYPHKQSGSLNYNHVKHQNKHFKSQQGTSSEKKRKFVAGALEDCTTCHMVEGATREVNPGPFDKVCAVCHESNIGKSNNDLLVFQLPQIDEPFKKSDVMAVCGPTQMDYEKLQAENEKVKAKLLALKKGKKERAKKVKYEKKDTDENLTNKELQPLMQLFFGDSVSEESSKEAVHELLKDMAEIGSNAFVLRLEDQDKEAEAMRLFAGLPMELVQKTACNWMLNKKYSAPEESSLSGWFAGEDGTSIRYRATTHKDPVIKAWFDFAFAAKKSNDDSKVGEKVMAALTDGKDKPGACAKCHVSGSDEQSLHWGLKPRQDNLHTEYNHAPHIELLGTKESCQSCHKLNESADYEAYFKSKGEAHYISGFQSIKRETCAECHAEKSNHKNCQLCHVYHNGSSFKKSMVFNKKHSKEQAR